MKRTAILGLVICWALTATHAAVYYVAKSGNDANSGSSTSPWLTIQKAANTLQAGDTVIVRTGRYSESVTTARGGVGGAPIIFRGEPGASVIRFRVGHPFVNIENFDISGGTTPNGAAVAVGASNVRVTGNNIHDTVDQMYGVLTINLAGAVPKPYVTNLYIANNSFRNVFGHNLMLFADDSLIESNRIHDTYMDAIRAWGDDTIYRGNIISNLYIYGGNHPDVIQTFGVIGAYHYARRIIFENNQAYNSYAQPCNLETFGYVEQYGDWIFRNNLFVGIAGQGNVGIPRTRWYNNTFYRSASNHQYAITFLKQTDYDSEDAIVMNNLFIACGEFNSNSYGWYFVSANLGGRFTGNYNYVAGLPPTFPSKSGFIEANGVNGGDPRFVNAGMYNFMLQSNSPAIDRGITLSGFNYDLLGRARPAGAAWDIGAYEFAGEVAPPPPPPPPPPTSQVAVVTLSGLTKVYNGATQSATVTTSPTGLTVQVTYSQPPVNAGSYLVTATVDDPVYTGSATGTLMIVRASQSLTFAAIPDQLLTNVVRLSASASSGLVPAFSVVSGPAQIISQTNLYFNATGTVSIAAAQAGNSNWLAAVTLTNTFTVREDVTEPPPPPPPPPSGENIYHVSKLGNDSGDGSLANPWLTIQKAASVLQPGDTVIVQAGRYEETVTTARGGVDGAPVVYRGQPGASLVRFRVGHPFVHIENFDISGGAVAYNAAVGIGASNVRVTGNTIQNTIDGMYGILTINLAGSVPKPYVTNLYIGGNLFRNVFGHNLTLFADDTLVESNRIHDTYMDAIRVWGSNVVFRANVVSNLYIYGSNHPDVIQTFGAAGAYHYAKNIIFENNESYNSYAQPCNLETFGYVDQYGDWTFRNNLFVGIAGQGNVGIPRTRWYNNTFYRSASNHQHAITFLKQTNYDAEDAEVMNNLFIACGEFDSNNYGWYFVSTNLSGRFTADYNYVAGLPPSYPGKTGFSEPRGINGGNPQFVNAATYDFMLSEDSPALEKATTLTGFDYDLRGWKRPVGKKWDIGAYEDATTPPPAPKPPGRVRPKKRD